MCLPYSRCLERVLLVAFGLLYTYLYLLFFFLRLLHRRVAGSRTLAGFSARYPGYTHTLLLAFGSLQLAYGRTHSIGAGGERYQGWGTYSNEDENIEIVKQLK